MSAFAEVQAPAAPSVAEIAFRFAQFGLRGFGGLIAHGRHFFVEERRWLDDAAFIEIFSIAQALPGANFVSVGIMLGDRFRGPAGSVAAVAGLCIPSLVLAIGVLSLARLSLHNPLLLAVESAVVAATAGQIIAIGLRVIQTAFAQPAARPIKLLACANALATIALTVAGVPLPISVLALIAVNAVLARAWRNG